MDKKEFYVKESLKLFLRNGIKDVTVGQITKELNVSSKTLYRMFDDKSGLVLECLKLYQENTNKKFNYLLKQEDKLLGMMSCYAEIVTGISRANSKFPYDVTHSYGHLWDTREFFGYSFLKNFMVLSVKEGILLPQIDPAITANTIVILLKSYLGDEEFTSRPGYKKIFFANVIWPYIKGVCTEHSLTRIRELRTDLSPILKD